MNDGDVDVKDPELSWSYRPEKNQVSSRPLLSMEDARATAMAVNAALEHTFGERASPMGDAPMQATTAKQTGYYEVVVSNTSKAEFEQATGAVVHTSIPEGSAVTWSFDPERQQVTSSGMASPAEARAEAERVNAALLDKYGELVVSNTGMRAVTDGNMVIVRNIDNPRVFGQAMNVPVGVAEGNAAFLG